MLYCCSDEEVKEKNKIELQGPEQLLPLTMWFGRVSVIRFALVLYVASCFSLCRVGVWRYPDPCLSLPSLDHDSTYVCDHIKRVLPSKKEKEISLAQ
jgi:hypothetical protein